MFFPHDTQPKVKTSGGFSFMERLYNKTHPTKSVSRQIPLGGLPSEKIKREALKLLKE